MSVPYTRTLLLVITKGTWGGAQKNVLDVAGEARREGYRVVVAGGTAGELAERLARDGISYVVLPGLGRDIDIAGDMRAYCELKALIRKERPDVVHAHSSKAGLLATLAARRLCVPRIIFTAHGWAFNEQRPWWQKIIFAKLHYLTVLLSDITICVSGAVMRDAWFMPFVQKRFRVIHNGIASRELLSKEVARTALMPDTNTEDALWIGTIAELHKTKGLDVLITAFANITDKHNTHLVILGEGSEREKLEVLIEARELRSRVHLLGHVPDAASQVKAFDIFVLPSRSEALGYALLEAGLGGVSAIASNVGGIPEIITDNESGVLVPPGNARILSKMLKMLIEDDALRVRLGAALRAKVTSTFSLSTMLEKTLQVYKK